MPAGVPWTPEAVSAQKERIRAALRSPSLPTSSAELGEACGTNPTTLRQQLRNFGLIGEAQDAYAANKVVKRASWAEDRPGKPSPASARPERPEPSPEIVGAGPKVTPDIEAIRQNAARQFRATAQRAERKSHQRVTFPHGPVCLVFAGDQHIGNAGTDIDRVFAEQEMINATPGAFVWQMGDPIDTFIVGKLIAENWKPSLPVWEQWQLAGHYFDGFGGKMVAYTGGNHDAWALKLSGIDYRRDICPEGVLYDGDDIKADVHVGPHRFRVWARHKWKGKAIYNQTHGQERAARFDSARYDVYVGAHLHTGAVAREFTLDHERKIAIQTGSYKIHDSYAREQGFPGHDSSTACALILWDDGSFNAMSDLGAALNVMRAVYRG